ncbi:MAG: CRISPR-associated ring nuclease [Anaerolineae bacterium]
MSPEFMKDTTSQARTVLVATLGGQPQVVTFGLDLLLARGTPIDEVVVVSLAAARYRQALRRLAEAFPGDRYGERPIHLRAVPVTRQGRPLDDVCDTTDADAVWRTMHELIATLKERGVRLHLLLTGGRRLMALMAVSAAMLYLEHGDRAWHLYTPDPIAEAAADGALLHVPLDAGVQLIEVPLAPLGAYFPGIRPLLSASPAEVIASRTRWLDDMERTRCQMVLDRLSERQRDVLHAFAAGLTPTQVADRLAITLKTVDTHKSAILAECRVAWNMPEAARLSYHWLHDRFGRFFETE